MNVHVLVSVSKDREFDTVEKRIQVKILKDEERVAFESYRERIIGTSFSEKKSFLIVGVDGELPIQRDDYTAFGRISGEEWVRAEYTDSI